MANIVPYINFGSRSQEAINFYKIVFGGDAEIQTNEGKIVQLEFRSGTIHFMGSDLSEDNIGINSLIINCDSEQQLKDFHSKLIKNGTELYSPTDSGWGAIVSHCADQFRVNWMLNYDKPSQ